MENAKQFLVLTKLSTVAGLNFSWLCRRLSEGLTHYRQQRIPGKQIHMWISLHATWFDRGKTMIDGISNGQALDSWRVGGAWSFPLAKGHSLPLRRLYQPGYGYRMVLLVYRLCSFDYILISGRRPSWNHQGLRVQ